MSARIYLEGGGDSKDLHARCREGFRRLFERSGFEGRMPRLVACGGRDGTFDDFSRAHNEASADFVAMLVDSEEPVADCERPWAHLRALAGWEPPAGATDEQALLMITSMETWIASDRSLLRARFGEGLQESALPPLHGIENKARQEVFQALKHATRECQEQYGKGRVSFEILGQLAPDALRTLSGFSRMVRILEACL